MSAISAPKCRLCARDHWPRDGCDFGMRTAAAPTAKPVNPKKLPTGRALRRVVKKKAKRK